MGAWLLPGEYPNRVDAARTDGFEALFGGAVLPRNLARGLDQGGVERGSAHPVGQALERPNDRFHGLVEPLAPLRLRLLRISKFANFARVSVALKRQEYASDRNEVVPIWYLQVETETEPREKRTHNILWNNE